MTDRDDDFRIRPRRSYRRSPGAIRMLPFVTQVQIAVRKAGGNPNRIGGAAGAGAGRFNSRGRGAKVVASFPKEGGGWQRDSAGRFRMRRVVVKARVVKLARSGAKMRGATTKAVHAHVRYLERDGVTRDGEKGRAYSAFEADADSGAFLERGREDRHQFRFIVAPEDAAEIGDLRGFTSDLIRQMEQDLGTRLDWMAVDHHNTGHPHSHVIVRGVTEDGKILNIAGDYIAHGIRHRASELVTRELGHQSEIELEAKLAAEVTADRLTRLDRMLLAEQQDQGIIDLRPGEGASYLVQENRSHLVGRVRRLESFELATEVEPGRWVVAERAEATLKELGERGDVIKTMHRALAEHGLERSLGRYVRHGEGLRENIVGRVLAKGLAGDELGERVYVVIDGADGRVHHMEFRDPARIEGVARGMIIEAAPAISGPRSADRNIAAAAEHGLYRPSQHLERIRESFTAEGKDPDAYVRFHVRRLEALRRAGHVERLDDDHWRIPADLVERGQRHDRAQHGEGIRVRTLATLDLERQITSQGATWLDRQLVAANPTPLAEAGFGREVTVALRRRAGQLVKMGFATVEGTDILIPAGTAAALERQEVDRVGRTLAAERGLTYAPSQQGEYVSGRLAGVATLVSGRFAMIDDGLGFQLVPWQPVLDSRLGQHITGIARDTGIDWTFGRNRGLGR